MSASVRSVYHPGGQQNRSGASKERSFLEKWAGYVEKDVFFRRHSVNDHDRSDGIALYGVGIGLFSLNQLCNPADREQNDSRPDDRHKQCDPQPFVQAHQLVSHSITAQYITSW